MNNSTQLSPYLKFDGSCREAMEFYKSVFGGTLEISTFGKFSDPSMPVPDDYKDKVMHSTLTNDALSFMASDGAPGSKVDLPLSKQVWGDTFGMLTDKFGIHWMVNIGVGSASEKA